MSYYTMKYNSPIGELIIASDGKNIVGLWMIGQKYFGSTLKEDVQEKPDQIELEKAKNWLDRYFANEKPVISELSLSLKGSDFRLAVWKILCDIPYGEVISYGEIARKIAKQFGKKRMSSQAVGGAVGHNPISIIVPCHRVVGTSGSLTGFAGGLDKKIKLLEMEAVDIKNLFVPKKGSRQKQNKDKL